jgi:hypothetical protein
MVYGLEFEFVHDSVGDNRGGRRRCGGLVIMTRGDPSSRRRRRPRPQPQYRGRRPRHTVSEVPRCASASVHLTLLV